jgi:hypothetical protein
MATAVNYNKNNEIIKGVFILQLQHEMRWFQKVFFCNHFSG